MKDQYKTKKQLIEELKVLRNQLVEPKKAETKRKRVKEALQTTNERLNYLLTSTSAAIYTSKTSGDYGATSVTENVKQMMGYEPREFIKNSSFWIGHVHPEDRQRLLNELPRIFEQESYIYEYRFLHKDGSYRWVCDDMKLIKDEFGRPIEIIGYWTDITERKRAEEELKESERRFRTIFEGAIDAILLADIETKKFHTGNKMICKMLGYSLKEVKSLSVTDIHPKEALPFVMEQFDKLARGEITKTSELPVKRKDGSVFYAEISTVLLKLDAGTYLMGTFRDITERKRAEEELRESEERFRLAFENANTGVCLVDLEGNLTRVNNKMCEIFGYTKEEFERMTVNGIAHPEDIDKSPSFIEKTLSGEINRGTFEKRYIHKKGHVVTCEVSSSLVRNAEGSPLYFISHVHDITERKQAEEALRERQETINAIIETSQDWIWAIDSQGVHTYSNPATEKILGYRPDEIVGSLSFNLMHEGDKKMVESILQECEEKRCGWKNLLLRWRHKNGTYRYLESNAVPILDSKGDLVGFRGVDRDITERKRTEEALRESELKYRTILENIEDGYFEVDLAGNIRFFNEAMCRIHGRSHDELMGLNNREFQSPETARRIYAIFNRVYRTGIPARIVDYEVIRKDGSVAVVEESVSLLRNASGEPIGFYGVSRDRTEQRKAEEALRQSEERYRTILEDIEEGYFEIDLAGRSTFVNDSLCKIHGYPREELLGIDYHRFTDKENAKKVFEAFNQVYRTGEPGGLFDYEIIRKDGTKRQVEVITSLRKDSSGNPIGFRGIVRDVTERKRAEEALRQSEERYRTILEDIEEGYFEADLSGRFTFANESMCRIHGYPREELLGMDYRRFVDKENAKKAFEAFNRVYRTGEPGRLFNYEIIRKDGTKRQVEVFPSLRKDSSGKPIGFRGITRDVTERKQAEELLRKEREISLSILQNAPYGVALIDKGGQYIYINPEFTNITGYILQDIPTGKDWFQKAFSDPKDRERMLQLWKEDRSKGNMINREFGINCKDGKIREIEIRSTFLKDGRAVTVLHDITEQKRAEERMESLQEQLRQSQKMEAIGRLAGGIAHDFNNLLTIIKGYSQLSLIELKEDTPLKGNIVHIHTATDRAADLVRQLLAFSRRQILEMKVIDLNTTLANLQNMLRRLIGEDIELTTILAEDLGRVKTDLGWIEQAIMNLVVNAKDAMATGGKLTIETGNAVLDEAYVSGRVGVKPGRYVMLSVSDTGVGMTPEVRERLFEPFFSTKEKDKGTGLGLSTVYGIVKQSGGDIWVYSEPGKGSTFKIYLPRVDEPLEERKERLLGDELLRGSETILLVEDEQEVRKLAVHVLERQGYKVLAAPDGDEALLICERHQGPIHLMLTDVVMPGMNGYEVAKRLGSLHPETKVLYMSGYTDNAIVLHGVLVEGVNYIQKPFTVDALTKKVREVLEQ